MEPTVLAGAIEFSPAEIALIVAVLIAAFVVVTAPGWAVLGYVMGRLPAPGASQGKRWAARAGGAGAGLAITAGVSSLLGPVVGFSPVVTVPLAWGACWALAALLHRRTPPSLPSAPLPAAPLPAAPRPPAPISGSLPAAPISGSLPPHVPPASGQGWGR